MVDILLAHSFFIRNDPKQLAKMRPYPPLGTLYAAAALRNLGFKVALFDAMLAEGVEDFRALDAQLKAPLVVLYEDQFNFLNKMCLLHSRNAACEMAKIVRARGGKVAASGADVTDHPEIYLSQGVQYALLGEADGSVCELACALAKNETPSPNEIAGLAVSDPDQPGGLRRSLQREPSRNLDSLPLPAWDLLDAEKYRDAWTRAHGHFSLNMVTTRGCPFHCNWCAKPIWGQRYAIRSPEKVAQEMAFLKRTIRPDHIWFADDIFGLQPKWVIEFANEVQARAASIPFTIQSRVDLMTEEAVAGLARAGCDAVWLGAESGSQKILNAMDKGVKVGDIPIVRERLRRAGIRACYFIQFGYAGEDFSDIMATVRLVRETLPDDIGISVSNPLPGTKFYRMVKDQLEDKDQWEHSNDLAMLFQGTYQTPFYRKLHHLLHEELKLLQQMQRGEKVSQVELDAMSLAWQELDQLQKENLSACPTVLPERETTGAPDLSKRWN